MGEVVRWHVHIKSLHGPLPNPQRFCYGQFGNKTGAEIQRGNMMTAHYLRHVVSKASPGRWDIGVYFEIEARVDTEPCDG